MEFKEKLARYRKLNQLSQEELGKKVGLTKRTIINYETGLRKPNTRIIEKLAEALNVEITALLDETDAFLFEATKQHGSRGKSAAERLISSANALFAGGDISEEDKKVVFEAIQEAYWESKQINKKYTPKKYRKNNEDNE